MGPTNFRTGYPPSSQRVFPAIAIAATISALAVLSCDDDTVPPEPLPEPASITVTPETALLSPARDTVRLVAEVLDENGEVIDGFPVSWTSSDASVATVGESGLVGAVAEGTATITATAGSVSAAAAITVILDLDRAVLTDLYHATGGLGWYRSSGWLTDAPLDEWYGVEVGEPGRVTGLSLSQNGLSGSIPPEIGSLDMLEVLSIRWSDLTGPLPPELGQLDRLKVLELGYNDIDGVAFPPEWLQLEMLETLELTYNGVAVDLSELAALPSLRTLLLNGMALSGPLPPELTEYPELRDLDLGLNYFSGPIPPGITGMDHFSSLNLYRNRITGGLPEAIGRLSTLTSLNLTDTDMSGTLPLGLTEIEGLDSLLTGGTDLCGPDDEGFRQWLRNVQFQRVHPCAGLANESTAYLTQEVQSRQFPVPLVADKDALLRVFVVAPQAEGQLIPPVRATFYVDGVEVGLVDISPDSSFIRNEVNESSLGSSANAVIPASVIRPGLEMVVEIDPDSTLDPALGVARRIPETGRMDVDVREVPALALTLIPFIYAFAPDSSILEITDGLEAEDSLLWNIRTHIPMRELNLTVHEPVATNSVNPLALMLEVAAIRVAEEGRGHYMGTLSAEQADYPGVSTLGVGWSSFSIPVPWVMAHELGHNLTLRHAPCGPNVTTVDNAFPQADGSIGAWGYRFEENELVPPGKPDFMSYCGPDVWVSEFFFSNMLRFRFEFGNGENLATANASGPSLLVWGGVGADGIPFLNPAFVLDAAATLPRSAGPYGLRGVASDGAELFSLSFDMPEIADGEGGSSFAFAVPAHTSWGSELARITLYGPDGSVSLDAETDRPAAILRDPSTGRIRAIYQELPATMMRAGAAAMAPEPGLEVLFSRGLPRAAEWLGR